MDTNEIVSRVEVSIRELIAKESFQSRPRDRRLEAIRRIVFSKITAEIAEHAYAKDMGVTTLTGRFRNQDCDLNDKYFQLLLSVAEIKIDECLSSYQ